ncbi:MAG: hypothetical protein ABSH16_10940 [Sedimentisphaerales bacterium]
MKNLMKKMLLVVSAMVIALGTVTMVSGCKKKEATPTKKEAEKKIKDNIPE